MRVTEAEYQAIVARTTPKRNKFGAVKTTVDGIRFDSKREAARWQALKLLERADLVRNLRRQVRFPLVVHGALIATWIADFVYDERRGELWATVREDCKGFRTRDYRLKKKLVRALYGWEIRET